MALFWSEGTSLPGIGTRLQTALRRRLTEAGGLVLLAVGAGLAVSLLTYHAGDPSHFSAPGAAPQNWLGRPGAVLADPLIRFFGLGAGVLAAFPAVWGLRFLFHAGEERIWARLLLLPVALVMAALFASTHAVPSGWPLQLGLGGILGDMGVESLVRLLPVPLETAALVLTLVLAPLAVASIAAAFGATAGELRAAGAWMLRSLVETAPFGRRRAAVPKAKAPKGKRGAKARKAPEQPRERRSWLASLPRLSLQRRRADTAEDGDAAPEPPAAEEPPRRRAPKIERPRPAPAAPAAAEKDEAEAEEHPATALSTAIRALRAGPKPERIVQTGPALDDLGAAPAPRGRAPVIDDAPDDLDEDETLAPERGERESAGPEPYDAPPLALLERPGPDDGPPVSEEELQDNARQLETVLADYGVRGEITAVKAGPVVTLYELEPAPGLKASRVIGLADDIARSMSALSARVSTVPGRTVIGIELPNAEREKVLLREVFESPDYAESAHPLALALGKTIEGAPCIANLARMPHLLIAGTTGSGKSVAINTMILSLLYRLSPEECRLIMIDPKMLELSVYDGIPHLLAPVVTDPKKALVALKWVVAEMEDRYRKMSKLGVRNIDGFNARVRDALARGEDFHRTVQTGFDEATGEPLYETETFAPEPMPLIVVIVDEMADLMMVAGKEIEACIQRLAQMARASGIHLIMATQRPSVDVITGTIKANFPTRISFQVTSKIDSRTILGEQGAEQLLGMGDMLYMAGGGRIRRVHGPFVSDDEVEEVVRHLKTLGVPDYVDAVTDGGDEDTQALVDEKLGLGSPADSDETLYDKAVAIVARDRKCSTSYIQRKLQIGYNKAARLVEEMEQQGVVTPANAVGKREILIEER